MSTRSAIGRYTDGDDPKAIQAVYHHSDGYPMWMGAKLWENINKLDGKTEAVVRFILNEKVGWSAIGDMFLPPKWSDLKSDTIGNIHVYLSTYEQWLNQLHLFNTNADFVPDDIDHIIKTSYRTRDINEIRIYIHSNGDYACQISKTITPEHPDWKMTLYWLAAGSQSYTERGEQAEHSMLYDSIDSLYDAGLVWAYIFSLQNNTMDVYLVSKPLAERLDVDYTKPIVTVDLDSDEPNWAVIENGNRPLSEED